MENMGRNENSLLVWCPNPIWLPSTANQETVFLVHCGELIQILTYRSPHMGIKSNEGPLSLPRVVRERQLFKFKGVRKLEIFEIDVFQYIKYTAS